jgi:hypothetical protein
MLPIRLDGVVGRCRQHSVKENVVAFHSPILFRKKRVYITPLETRERSRMIGLFLLLLSEPPELGKK